MQDSSSPDHTSRRQSALERRCRHLSREARPPQVRLVVRVTGAFAPPVKLRFDSDFDLVPHSGHPEKHRGASIRQRLRDRPGIGDIGHLHSEDHVGVVTCRPVGDVRMRQVRGDPIVWLQSTRFTIAENSAITLAWVSSTPLGGPVVPEV